jgi:hypothetical protein
MQGVNRLLTSGVSQTQKRIDDAGRSVVPERSPQFQTCRCRWSIEGAIGSKHKVDASYLSPNVNMAARLETATKQYGVSILMSGEFAALLSPAVRAKCRQIDTVLVKGSNQPMGIWTVDLDTRSITADTFGSWQNLLYVHDTKSGDKNDGADVGADEIGTLHEFCTHQDIYTAYCVDPEFLQAWRVCSLSHQHHMLSCLEAQAYKSRFLAWGASVSKLTDFGAFTGWVQPVQTRFLAGGALGFRKDVHNAAGQGRTCSARYALESSHGLYGQVTVFSPRRLEWFPSAH